MVSGCSPDPRADLVIHNGAEAETIDPQVLTGQPDGRVASALFEGLTRFDPRTGRGVPGLAHSWDISPDGLRYTFHLRTNAAFSTGEPIHAEDFVWSWRRAVDPVTAADYSGFFFYVKGGQAIATGATNRLETLGIRAVDPATFEVTLVNPTPFFPDLCAMRIMAVIPRATVERLGDQWVRADPLPCSGPYQLESWRPNDRIRLRANPHYWDAASVGCERVDLLSGDSPTAALNLYLTGDVDFLIDKVVIPSELGDVLVRRPDFHSYAYLATYFFRFNVTRKPFDDPRVRRAIGLVVDRRRIVERITRMGEQPASALTPPGTGGYVPPAGLGHAALLATNAADYAVAMRAAALEAQRLLAEAGYPGGSGFPPFTYMFNAGGGGGARQHENIGVEMQASLREHLGLQMELRPVEWKTYLSDMSQLNFDMIRGSWVGDYQDPTTFLDCFLADSGNNRTGWRSTRYDGLLSAAAAEPDSAKRFALLREAETLLVREEAPIVTLYSYVGLFAFDPERWEGIHPNLTGEHPVWAIRRRVAGGARSAVASATAP
ncbi:MAG: peptide ABC transporter substrate-binding protein [Verrucomicrobia bacterium]|nr:peptide ABC transporter substrate-binding protein [Verrucomicrobiota bacterium]